MFTRLDDIVALLGFCCVIAGVFLWLGLAAALIITGIVLIFAGVRMEPVGTRPEPVTLPPGERRNA